MKERTGISLRIIGLTGGIACGKSTVSDWLQQQPDCTVIDGDQLSRELTARNGAALPFIMEAFGSEVFFSDGTLNRRRLGAIVFSDPESMTLLNGLMKPMLENLTQVRLKEAQASGVSLCFLDFPLLFECGYDQLCDSVWCVYLPRDLQLSRLMTRDGLTREDAERRIDAVLSSEEKAARSSVVIDNSSTISFTLSTLPPLLDAERRSAGPSRRRRARRYESAPDLFLSEEGEISSPVRNNSSSDSTGGANDSPPVVMERPASSRKGISGRKAAWSLPSWLIKLLTAAGALVLMCLAALMLMNAYLTRQETAHLNTASGILRNYPLEYRDFIVKYAEEYNLAPAFVSAIVRNESSFQPHAESSVGARGLMQLMPDTAEWIAGKLRLDGYAFDRMYDPESNIRFGCWYLNYLSSLFRGDPVCVACAYHAGQGQVTAWLSDPVLSEDGIALQLSNMPDGPTKTYAGRVIRAYGIYQTLYFNGSDVYDVLLPRYGR